MVTFLRSMGLRHARLMRACAKSGRDFLVSESVTVQMGHCVRLHSVVREGDFLVRWALLPSRQLDPAARWHHTPRLWDLPVGMLVQQEGDGSRPWRVTAGGSLEPIPYAEAVDILNPPGRERRAIAHYLSRTAVRIRARANLERLQGEDLGYVEGVHGYETPEGTTVVYAERVTSRQAWIRVATQAEAEAAGFGFTVGPERDVTVLCLAKVGRHPVEGADAGSART